MKSCHFPTASRWTRGLAVFLLLAAFSARGADVIIVAQSGEVGQELLRLKTGLRDSTLAPQDRKVPPEVSEELNRAAERAADRAADEGDASVEKAVEAAADAEPAAEDPAPDAEDAALEDAEDAAERLLEEMGAEAEAGETDPPEEVETDAEDPAPAVAETPVAQPAAAPDAKPAPSTRSTRSSRSSRRGGSYDVKDVQVNGDVALMESLGLLDQLKQDVIGKTLDDGQIKDLVRNYNKLLVEEGYYLALLFTPPSAFRDLQSGTLTLEIDQGRVGATAFYEEIDGEKVPYRGRYFSEKQLQRRLGNVREDEPFLYDEFYKSVFTVNSHPDLTMDTDLKVRKEREGTLQRRFVDMDFTVEERIPIHAVVEVQNSGTESTEEWRIALTVQHLNLTKHDDVLTLTLPTSIDFSTVRSLAGSYYVPHYLGSGGAFTVYGGVSQLDTEDLVQDVDLEGNGWFSGIQGTYELIASDRHTLNLSLGYTYQVIEDTLILGDSIDTPREVTIGPVSFVVSYSSVRPDWLGGRNFLTSQTSFNRGGVLGSSEDEEMQLQRETAEADYAIERLQFARIQPLRFRRPAPVPEGEDGAGEEDAQSWIAFLRLDGQLATGPLIPAEQKAVGGLDNVRGYHEREILGDHGISGTLELRSPIWVGDLTSGLGERQDTAGGSERLQVVLFVDAAQMYLDDTLESQKDTFTLLSVGAGIRAAITKHAQFKFDYGFPLEETLMSDSSGRAHLSAEVQF